jgi:serine/threonine protein kinase
LELAGRYRIERFVARGGMGEVYEVYDTAMGERIALKTVASHLSGDGEAIAQLRSEVQLARRVSHKNVCRIYDLGTHETGDGPPIVFLSMELIEGESVAERLLRKPRPTVDEVRNLAAGILEGLAAAHEAGVLHRDLKGENVMLRETFGGGVSPVLMDFGLASALNPNSSRVSGDGALVGSLAYMAPEQVQGEPLRVATDLYAFGVIVFEMLTGRLPFEASTPAVAAIRRLQEAAPRLRDIRPELPADLDRVIGRCLERDPKDRFGSAREVLTQLSLPLTDSERTPSTHPGPSSDHVTAKNSIEPETQRDPLATGGVDAPSTPAASPATRRPNHAVWLVAAVGLGTLLLTARSFQVERPAIGSPTPDTSQRPAAVQDPSSPALEHEAPRRGREVARDLEPASHSTPDLPSEPTSPTPNKEPPLEKSSTRTATARLTPTASKELPPIGLRGHVPAASTVVPAGKLAKPVIPVTSVVAGPATDSRPEPSPSAPSQSPPAARQCPPGLLCPEALLSRP